MNTVDKKVLRLPDVYARHTHSKIYKLLSLPGEQIDDILNALEKTALWRDIEEAEGKALDNMGSNVQVLRGGKGDDLYRQHIKTKIVSNLSGGEAETLNTVLSILMGDKFIGLHEGWDYPNIEESALIMAEHSPAENWQQVANIEHEIAKRIVAAGVRFAFLAVENYVQKYESEQTAETSAEPLRHQFFYGPGMTGYDWGRPVVAEQNYVPGQNAEVVLYPALQVEAAQDYIPEQEVGFVMAVPEQVFIMPGMAIYDEGSGT